MFSATRCCCLRKSLNFPIFSPKPTGLPDRPCNGPTGSSETRECDHRQASQCKLVDTRSYGIDPPHIRDIWRFNATFICRWYPRVKWKTEFTRGWPILLAGDLYAVGRHGICMSSPCTSILCTLHRHGREMTVHRLLFDSNRTDKCHE
jgi:hypothetical protein